MILPYKSTTLRNIIDMDAIRSAGFKVGIDPLGGGAGFGITGVSSGDVYKLNLEVGEQETRSHLFVHDRVDHDGKKSAWIALVPMRCKRG